MTPPVSRACRHWLAGASVCVVLALPPAVLAQQPAAPAATDPETAAPGTAAPADADPLVATVNGAPIFRSDIGLMLSDLPEHMQNMPNRNLFQEALNQLIVRKLLAAEARALKLDDGPEAARRLAFAADGVLQRLYAEHYLDTALTEDVLRATHAQMVSDLGGQDEISARHILVKTEQEALAVIADLRDGSDFETLARDRSIGPSGKVGGQLGWFSAGQMVPAFSAAAFALDVGATSAVPVQTQFGWHVIKVEDRRTVEPPSYEDSIQDLRQAQARDLINRMITSLQEKADIQIFDSRGNQIVVTPDAAPGLPQRAD